MVDVVRRVGAEVLVNTQILNSQLTPRVATLDGGGYVIVWNDGRPPNGTALTAGGGLKAQLFDPFGGKVGSEFIINTSPGAPSEVLALNGGGFAVTWVSAEDGSASSVAAQVFNASGARIGGETVVNTAVANGQSDQYMARLSNGGFVVAWYDEGAGFVPALKAQIFNDDGIKIGPEIKANTLNDRPAFTGLGETRATPLTALGDGGFVLGWVSQDPVTERPTAKGQVFSANGGKVGDEIVIPVPESQYKFMGNASTQVTALRGGGFVVVTSAAHEWPGNNSFFRQDLHAQVFTSSGAKVGGDILVAADLDDASYDQTLAKVAALSDSGFAIAWQSLNPENSPREDYGIRAQSFTASGARNGAEIHVNTTTQGAQQFPLITGLGNGGFVVAWKDASTSTSERDPDVRAQVFRADGTAVGAELLVNTATRFGQLDARIAAVGQNGFVVTWRDDSGGIGGAPGDADGTAVKAQLFAVDLGVLSTLSIAAASADKAEGTGGATAFTFTVTRTGDSGAAQSAAWRVTGSAVDAADFADGALPSGSIQFAAGETTGTITVNVLAESRLEADETFTVTLSGPTPGATIGAESATGTIRNDDVNGVPTPGQDFIFGGADADTIVALGGPDLLSASFGNDVLVGDGPLSLTEKAEAVRRLYIAALDRAPDDAGWIDWTRQIDPFYGSIYLAANGFVESPEFKTKYGTLDNESFVTLLYRNVLERQPDAGGLAAYTGALNNDRLSRRDVLVIFSESAEFVTATKPTLHAGQVYRLYGATLARAPDAGGFETWTDALGNGRGLVDIAAGFVNSTEFQLRYGALDNAGFVTLLYQNVLGRAPDSGGLAFWTGQLNGNSQSRTQVVTGFSESTEYIAGTRAGVDAFMRNVMTAWSDTLDGGQDDDRLTGGRGSDRYVFNAAEPGNDTVYGFETFDTLQLTGFAFATPAQALAAISQQGANAVLAFNGGSITFADTQVSVLQSLPAQGWLLG